MGKFSTGFTREIDFSNQIHPKLVSDPRFTQLKKLMNDLEQSYNLSSEELVSAAEKEIIVPISIYGNKELSALEATTRYLKENLNLRYKDIATLLNRDERTIWTTYNKSSKEIKLKTDSKITLPIELLQNRKYSVLELVTGYLKEEHNLRYNEIGKLLALDQRTIWTCYSRLQKKRGDKK